MRKKNKRILIVDLLVMLALFSFDQFTKHIVLTRLKGQPPIVLIDGVLELQYLENRGSAFGVLQNQKYFILFVGVIFLAVIFFFLFKLPEDKKFRAVHIALSAIVAGGLGNMADRFRFDYVVDFISFVLIHFPVFNAADCCIVISTILLLILFMFVYKESDLDFLNFKKREAAPGDEANG